MSRLENVIKIVEKEKDRVHALKGASVHKAFEIQACYDGLNFAWRVLNEELAKEQEDNREGKIIGIINIKKDSEIDQLLKPIPSAIERNLKFGSVRLKIERIPK